MGEPEDPDVSRYHIVTNPLYRREGFARSGRKDKQTTLALVFVEVEALLHRLERIQLMLERSFPNSPLLFVTEVVQDKGMKTHWDCVHYCCVLCGEHRESHLLTLTASITAV